MENTYFAIDISGKILYNQGCYIITNENGKVMFCIEPDVIIGSIEDNALSSGKYSKLSDN